MLTPPPLPLRTRTRTHTPRRLCRTALHTADCGPLSLLVPELVYAEELLSPASMALLVNALPAVPVLLLGLLGLEGREIVSHQQPAGSGSGSAVLGGAGRGGAAGGGGGGGGEAAWEASGCEQVLLAACLCWGLPQGWSGAAPGLGSMWLLQCGYSHARTIMT